MEYTAIIEKTEDGWYVAQCCASKKNYSIWKNMNKKYYFCKTFNIESKLQQNQQM